MLDVDLDRLIGQVKKAGRYDFYADAPVRKIKHGLESGELSEKKIVAKVISRLGKDLEQDCILIVTADALDLFLNPDNSKVMLEKVDSDFIVKLSKLTPSVALEESPFDVTNLFSAKITSDSLKRQIEIIDSLYHQSRHYDFLICVLGPVLYRLKPEWLCEVLNKSDSLLLQYFLTSAFQYCEMEEILEKLTAPQPFFLIFYRLFYNRDHDSVNKLELIERFFLNANNDWKNIFLSIFNEYPVRARSVQYELGQVLSSENINLLNSYLIAIENFDHTHAQAEYVNCFIEGFRDRANEEQFYKLLNIFHAYRDESYFNVTIKCQKAEEHRFALGLTDLFFVELNYYKYCSTVEFQDRLSCLLCAVHGIRWRWYGSSSEFISYAFFLLSELYILAEAMVARPQDRFEILGCSREEVESILTDVDSFMIGADNEVANQKKGLLLVKEFLGDLK